MEAFYYWEGPRTPILDLLRETIRKSYPKLKELGPEDIPEHIRNLDARPVHKSDLLRSWLLYRYGGIWIDADCISVRPIPYADLLRETGADLVGFNSRVAFRWFPTCILIGRKGSPVIQAIYDKQIDLIRERGKELRQIEAGPELVHQLRLDPLWEPFIGLVPRRPWLHPSEGSQPWQIFPEPYEADHDVPFYLAHVCGGTLGLLGDKSRKQILKGYTLLGRIVRRIVTED